MFTSVERIALFRCRGLKRKAPQSQGLRGFGTRGSGRRRLQGQTGDEHLLVKPQRLLGKHGELLVRDAVEMDTREVVADIDQPLTNPLVVTYRPGVYQFTSRL